MPEIFRTRDLVLFSKGPTYTVEVPDSLTSWKGGQVFNWTQPQGDQLLATLSDGLTGAVAFWGSDESSDEYTSMTRNQPTYKYVTLGSGSILIATTSYERYTYASRQGSPLVPLVYSPSDRLQISLNGMWTKEDEWTESGDPRAPNTLVVGSVVQAPTSERNNYLTIQTSL
jgi:hypothetical protein